MHQRQKTKTRWPGGKRHVGPLAGLLTIDIGAHFFRFVACIAQPVHRRAQLCLGLVELVRQLCLALLQIGDRLIAEIGRAHV